MTRLPHTLVAALFAATSVGGAQQAVPSAPAPKPGLIQVQLVDTVRKQLVSLGRVTALDAAGKELRVQRTLSYGVATLDSVPRGRIVLRVNAIGFVPHFDTIAYDPAVGASRSYKLKYAVVQVNTVVATGDGSVRRVPPR